MRYLLFVCADASGEPFDPSQNNIEEWVSSNDKKGSRLLGYRVDDVRKPKTVRVRRGQLLVTDGPFADTEQWLAAFDLLGRGGLVGAVEIAWSHHMARFGMIRARPSPRRQPLRRRARH